MSDIELSIVVPIYNESNGIQELYDRLCAALSALPLKYEVILVDDGSRDDSLKMIKSCVKKNNRFKYISFSRNFGHQVAISAGLDFTEGDAVVIMDGDLQDPPEVIPQLYEKYKEGYKVVYAKRRVRKGEVFYKKVAAKYFYRLLSKITAIDIPLDTGDFRIIDRIVVEKLKGMSEANKFLRGQIAWIGFKQTYVLFDREPRRYGERGYTLSKLIKLAIDGITAFSDFPLKMATILGIIVSIISFLVLVYALISKFVLGGAISGWTSLIITVAFLGGVQMLSIGIIGEYISRIHTDILKRPLYIVGEENITNKN